MLTRRTFIAAALAIAAAVTKRPDGPPGKPTKPTGLAGYAMGYSRGYAPW